MLVKFTITANSLYPQNTHVGVEWKNIFLPSVGDLISIKDYMSEVKINDYFKQSIFVVESRIFRKVFDDELIEIKLNYAQVD
jgi:hypothetical protein